MSLWQRQAIIHNLTISKCLFNRNTHMQTFKFRHQLADLESTLDQRFYGGLLSVNNMVTDLAKVIAVVNVVDSTFTDNYFTGEGSSLIYIQNGLIRLRGNTFRNNGQIVSDQIYTLDGRFMHKYYQEHGVVWVNNTGSSQLPRNFTPHLIESNVFCYLFADYGVATIMSQIQGILMSKNAY